MKKTSFPSSMIVVAAVVAFGMVGSQLDLGGLSGQAAGGEAAGCGGDAYYDEDLGALVDSEGNILNENGEVADDATGEERHAPFDAQVAGQAMNGQSLITIIRPMDIALEDLAADAGEDASFIAQANVSADGRYAIVAFIAEDYEEHNRIQLLQRDGETWMTIMEISDDREGITITDPVIADVTEGDDGDLVRFSFDGGTLLEFAVETQMVRSITRAEQNEMVLAKATEAGFDDDKIAEFQLTRLADVSILDFVQNRVQHPGLSALVADQFGADVEFTISTSLDNHMLVSLSNGEILAVQACEVGNTPVYVEGELTCNSCEAAGGCENILNKVDMMDVTLEQRLERTIEVRNDLAALNRLVERREFTTMLKSSGNHADGNAYEATHTVYDNATCAGHICWRQSGNKVIIRGSDDLMDWALNVISMASSTLGWGIDGMVIANSVGCNSKHWIGHSRGGAIAAWLANRCGGSATTYGAPSAGVNFSGTRYVHTYDPVQSLGSSGSSHAVGGKGMYWECVDRKWWGCKRHDWKEKNIGGNIGGTWYWNPWYMLKAHTHGYSGGDGWDDHKWNRRY